MISVARKNLFSEKLRLLISIGGVTFSSFLIMILLGIYAGVNIQITNYINKTQADIWVMEEGVTDMFMSFSLLSDDLKNQIERKTGGGKAYRLIERPSQLKVRPKDEVLTKRQREKLGKNDNFPKATILLIGFDTATGVGGPWKIKEGKFSPGKSEIIVDEMLAKNKNLKLGDNVEISNENFTVVGISSETNFVTSQMVFIDFNEARDLFNFKGKVNYYLVNLDDPLTAFDVKKRIENEIPNISAKTKKEFAITNSQVINESFMPIIFIIVIIGFLVGTVVVGLTIYTATMEKMREYGILKAIGAKNSFLYKVVFEQSLWTVFLGFLSGGVFTVLSVPLIQQFSPISIVLTPLIFLETFVAVLFMSIFASYIPIRKIAGVDPVTVFKS